MSLTTAGLQKWVFDGSQWKLAYTLQAGLNLGQPYTIPGYPTGINAAAPAADESFRTVCAAGFGEVLRGVAFTPER